jgi:hypothetical protein
MRRMLRRLGRILGLRGSEEVERAVFRFRVSKLRRKQENIKMWENERRLRSQKIWDTGVMALELRGFGNTSSDVHR